MNKKASRWMIGALALAVFAPTAAFAATNTNVDETKVEQAFYQKQAYFSLEDRESNQQELMKIINKYNPDLADDFQKLFDQHEKVKVELDEATKKQLDEIREQVKNGTLTQEQANEKLGVKGFDLGKMEKVKVELDEATKKQLDEIREQVKNGTLTQEQANEKLGVKGFDLGKMEKVKVEVDEATKTKLDEIREQMKNGTLTQEQVKEEMEKMGFKHAVREGKENIMEQIKVAADADDADTVNKLLHELLENMQNKKHLEANAE
ncbi:hypothetical protein [Brevibacillus laterosporus]|uniref:DUF5667 domain-containing protein n=1 Tax=Brevibacillus laterosporus TaxID=1465 RepID=A0AAP3GAV0_BRELA|nr:hypothetical protein [Brevibacillus laterosporus]MCR8980177.1 hypothetical protein [Brevibacillus laterosporus]MCZ0807332.1 hypothetical protein [Brevibacillus laterosporus]MCZ0825559.1 hypothetical protein [Brevibacillus laterosporus]MCZ0849336.1 hypothetical protein [Brevibacillus laterosporus]